MGVNSTNIQVPPTCDRHSTWFCGILDPDEEGASVYGDEAMSNYQYTIILHPDPDEGGYTVTVPALPGCVTQGETLEEAIAMAKDAIRLHVEALMSEGEPVPEEHEHPQAIIINVAA